MIDDTADRVGELLRPRWVAVQVDVEQRPQPDRQGDRPAVDGGDQLLVVDADRHCVGAFTAALTSRVRPAGGDPGADGIVAAGEEPGVVGVQALHAGARAADAAVRTRAACVRAGVAASRSAA